MNGKSSPASSRFALFTALSLLSTVVAAQGLGGCSAAEESSLAAPSDADAGKKKSAKKGDDKDGKKDPVKKKDAGANKDAGDDDDGSASDGGPRADAATLCTTAIAQGDLAIVEFMFWSQSAAGDKREWIEIENVRSCTLDVKGVRVSSPRAIGVADVATITTSNLIPPGGRFLVANSASAAVNGSLPGLVFAFAGDPSDVLGNIDDQMTIEAGGVLVDTIGYSVTSAATNVSFAFPESCSPTLRSDPGNWEGSKNAWATGKYGTPNAPNHDVTCQ